MLDWTQPLYGVSLRFFSKLLDFFFSINISISGTGDFDVQEHSIGFHFIDCKRLPGNF